MKSKTPLPKFGGRVCGACFTEKESSAYNSDKSRPDGLHPYCRECIHRKNHSPDELAKRRKRKAWAKPQARAYHHWYTRQPYVRTKTTTHNREYHKRFPERAAARSAVVAAERDGRLIRPRACKSCGRLGKVEAHHYNGYTTESVLDIVWLCRSCHRFDHRKDNPHISAPLGGV